MDQTFTVYVLYSVQYDKIYIGFTSNMEQRLLSHNVLGKKGYTLKYRPWKLVYTESYATKSEAMKREKQLKGGQGRIWIRENLSSW